MSLSAGLAFWLSCVPYHLDGRGGEESARCMSSRSDHMAKSGFLISPRRRTAEGTRRGGVRTAERTVVSTWVVRTDRLENALVRRRFARTGERTNRPGLHGPATQQQEKEEQCSADRRNNMIDITHKEVFAGGISE